MEEIQQSERRRGASLLQQAHALNSVSALVELGRLDEARSLLDRCREVFEREHEIAGLGKVFGALAQVASGLSHHDDAVLFDERSIRYAYVAGQVEDSIRGHHNMAIFIWRAKRPLELAQAQRIAALVIEFQIQSRLLEERLANLRMDLFR